MGFNARFVLAQILGIAIAVAIGGSGFFLLRNLWPDYAVAVPEKAYTVAMLIARLSLGVVATAVAAWVATSVAGDKGRAACWIGGLFLAVSLPNHLFVVWDDYPVWYHAVYLAYLGPIAGLTGRGVSNWQNGQKGKS